MGRVGLMARGGSITNRRSLARGVEPRVDEDDRPVIKEVGWGGVRVERDEAKGDEAERAGVHGRREACEAVGDAKADVA